MGGPTNFRSPRCFFDGASQISSYTIGYIQPANTQVAISTGLLPPEQFDLQWAKLLACGIHDCWATSQQDGWKVVPPPAVCSVPTIRITGAIDIVKRVLRGQIETARAHGDDSLAWFEDEFAFVMIVQGTNASKRSKLVIRYSVYDIAAAMMSEALNGFSVVFSAILARRDVSYLFRPKSKFFKSFTRFSLQQLSGSSKITFEQSEQEGYVRICYCKYCKGILDSKIDDDIQQSAKQCGVT